MTNIFTRKFALVGTVLALVVAATPAAALARHSADDPAGHVRGLDDGLKNVRGADDGLKHVRGSDDGLKHVRGGGGDDGPNHK